MKKQKAPKPKKQPKTKANSQPAKINYFFKGGYVELWHTIKTTFRNLNLDISDAWDFLADSFADFWNAFVSALRSIFSRDFEWSEILASIAGICKVSYGIGKLLCILVFTTSLCVLFSVIHIVVLLIVMLFAYLLFSFLLLSDILYRGIKKISSNCPNCQNRFSLPVYFCPDCGAKHTALKPGRYGIWQRTCECGRKLPTTFFNGRSKLEAHCPICGADIKDGGQHVDFCIPVIGGPNSGKTCFINQAITEIGKHAASYNLDYNFSSNGLDNYQDNMANIENGYLPEKTADMRLKYYQFYLTPKNVKLQNLIALCDVGGEVYEDSAQIGEQKGYGNADAFLMVIDPLSIKFYRDEISKQVQTELYGYSNESLDKIISRVISTLENIFNLSSKKMLNKDLAVVFSKSDIPGLDACIGDTAVQDYMNNHPDVSRLEAKNIVCESFLREHGETNFLNSLKSKFKSIQFFCASSLGHNADGTPFTPVGVEEPVLWLVDKISSSIDLKEKWK